MSTLNADDLKERIDPFYFYQLEQGELRNHQGKWAEAGLCPFHDDRSPGSFFINLQTGSFKCFSCDAKGGDIIAYVMQKYDLPFIMAVRKLANEEGLR